MARHTNEEIYISYLCDEIMAACNRINKKLDAIDEKQSLCTYTDSYEPPNPAPSWKTMAVPYSNNQPQPCLHQQMTPPSTYPSPPITHQPLQPPQTYQQQQLTCRATQMQPRHQFPQPNSCRYSATQQLHTPPQYPSYTNGPTVYSGYELYKQRIPQPPDPRLPYGVPTYGLPRARPQKQDPIHPVGQPPDTGQPAIGWCPLTSHHHSPVQLPAAAVPRYRGGPLEAVAIPDEAVVLEEVQDKSCSEVMLFNRKSYDGDEMLMVVKPSPAAISLPCSPNVNGEEGELFEDEPPLPAGIPPPCSPNQDYSDHTSVPIELVDSVGFEHLGKGNDMIEVNCENKDRDRVDEKKSLVLGEEENRAVVFLVVDIFEEPTYTILEVMEMGEVENSVVLLAVGSHFEATFPLEWWSSLKTDGEYNWTERSYTFDPGGNSLHSFYCDWKKFEAFIGTRTIIQIRCHAIVGYWGTKQ